MVFKSSQYIVDAQEQAANLRGIDPALDLGNDLTLAAFHAEIAAGNEFKAAEKQMRALSGRGAA
jgi:hypothetical protein